MADLAHAREAINRVDAEMAALFEQRMQAVEEVISYKLENGLPVLDTGREQQVLEQGLARIQNPVYREYYQEYLVHLMGLSKRYQRRLANQNRVGYQGTEGAFSYLALKQLFPEQEAQSFVTFGELVRAVMSGEVSAGVLPFENSYTGEVGEVLDLLYESEVKITRVFDLPVNHHLMALPAVCLEEIRAVYSHQQALSQCSRYLDEHGFERMAYPNTALAARYVAETGDRSKAAIASRETAELYGLEILAENINTSAENTTRFIVVEPAFGEDPGDRFSILFTVRHDAGALAGAMQVIARHGFNMESIRSKSIRNVPWQYYFYAELVGDCRSADAGKLLAELNEVCSSCRLLGSYRAGLRGGQDE